MVAQRAGAPHTPILLSGIVPPLADPYHPRSETGPDLAAGLRPGHVVVLAPGDLIKSASRAPSHWPGPTAAQGGTGKTQLAVEFANAMWSSEAVEVLVWVTATSRESVITGFAQAAASVGAGGLDDTAEVAASQFAAWLAHTRQPWAVIIDDLADTSDLDGLWPGGQAGQVVITTRLPGETVAAAAKSGGVVGDPVVIRVGGFSRREALGYLNARLTDFPDQRIEALDLGEDLDGLPLSIAQAAAVMTARQIDCREYRTQLSNRRAHMNARAVRDLSVGLLATWSIACECAHELPPAGLAWPALALAAMFDRHGIPGAVLTSPTACGYITGHPSTAGGADQNLVRRAISNLARADLVTIDPATPVRTVRIHPSVQAAVRAFIPQAELEQVVLAAADALVETWPEGDGGTELDQTMRDCAAALREVDSTILWKPEAHPLLFRAGMSFEGGRLVGPAIAYWQSMVSMCTRLVGPTHANAVQARDRLAAAYESAGRSADAIAVFASALNERERNLGPEHPDTISARARLAHAFASAGRIESIAIHERTLADSDRQLGPGHPDTLNARADLAAAYQAAGRIKDAIRSWQTLLADRERLQGSDHRDTRTARANLAGAYQQAGRLNEAIPHYERVLAESERMQGPGDVETLTDRCNLAAALFAAGRLMEVVAVLQRALSDCERYLGPDHPMTRTVQENLQAALLSRGRQTRCESS